MSSFNRRRFLGTSVGGLTVAALGGASSGRVAMAFDSKEDKKRDPLDSLFLTWKRDPTTTTVIQWVGGSKPADGLTVQYAPLDGKVLQTAKVVSKPFPDTDRLVHRCEITGLKPGSEYKFQVGSSSKEFRFQTMPAKATSEFRFITGGDAGTGSAAVTSNKLAAKQDPYFVAIGGDLAYDNGRAPDTFHRFLQNYHATMVDTRGRLIPMVSTLGNHEVNGGYNQPRDRAGSYLSVFDALFEETSYGVLDFGDYLSLLLLDTGHLTKVAGEQTSWLERTLADRKDHPHLFAMYHVPAYPSFRDPKNTGEDQRKLWCPLFERYGVNTVLEHHDHTFKRSHPILDGVVDEKRGVLYIGDGSWGKIRAPKPPEERPYLAKTAEIYHITVHELQGDRRIHAALDADGRIADLASTVGGRPSR